ncbi:MAG: acetate--CoA ligase family protein [Nocardioidaceae bacterium]
MLLSQPLPGGRRLAILGNAGGIGVLAADAAQAHGLEVPELAAASQEELQSLTPGAAGYTNPVDLSAAASPAAFAAAAHTLTRSPDVDALLLIVAATAVTDVKAVMSALDQALSSQRPLPALLVILGESSHAPSRLTVLPSVERAVAALAHACSYANWRDRSQTGRANADGVRAAQARHLAGVFLSPGPAPRWLTPAESFELLALFDIDVPAWRVVSTTTAAVEAAEAIGYPVVAKACLPNVVHKTDQGLIATQLRNASDVDVATRRLASLAGNTGSILIQAQAAPGTELALGVVNDSEFGPLLMVATGGVNLDVWSDQVFLMPPVTEDQVLDALRSLRSWPLLQGHRGQPAADVAAFVRLVVQVADLALDLPELSELDLNPVIVDPNGIACVDAKIRLRAPTSSAPEAAPALSKSPSLPTSAQ